MATPDHRYYVNYWCEVWRESDRIPRAQAEMLAYSLREVGAEVQIVQVQLPSDSPTFPDPSVDYEIDRVQFRLHSLKNEVFDDMADAESRQVQIQGLGLDVRVTIDAPLRVIPKSEPDEPPPDLPNPARWVGEITQQDRVLSAELVLSQRGGAVEGELSSHWEQHSYLVKVRGEIENGRVNFHSYEVVQGRVFCPVSYSGRLSHAGRLSGQWTFAPKHLAGTFDFALMQSADQGDR